MSESKVLPQFLAGLAAAFGAFAAGSLIGWTNPAQPRITAGELPFTVVEDDFMWIGSLMTLGAASVCIPIGFLINAWGRKTTMLLLVIPFTIGWALMIFAQNLIMIYLARFILGVSGGAFCICAPVYTTEIAQDSIRGTLGTFFQLMLVCGVLYAYAMGALVTKVFWLNVACAMLPIIFLLLFVGMPESPTYYVRKGKTDEALAALQRLRGADFDCSKDLNDLKAADEKTKANPVSLGEAMCRRVTLKALSISMLLMVFQQLSGINAVVFFSTDIFEEAGTGLSGTLVTILLGITMVVSTLFAVLIIDKLGRRVLLISSSVAIILTTTGFGFFFYNLERDADSVKSYTWLPVVCLFLFIVMFSVGFGPVPWLLMAELFTAEVKGLAGPIAGTTNWMSAFFVTLSFIPLRTAIGSGAVFFMFSIISLIGLVFIYFFVPETKGKSMTEIQEILEGTKHE